MSYEEEMYNYQFYHDREFHVERIERDKKIRNRTLFDAALQVVIIGAFAVGVILHGKGLAAETTSADALVADLIGTIWSAGLGITTLVELKNTITELKHIKIDIDTSKKMIQSLDESASMFATNTNGSDNKKDEQDGQGGIKR